MIKKGIVSVSFRKKTPREVVSIVKKSGLSAIEWGSDVHVPQGDIQLACEVRKMTIAEGIEIPSYGSYYKLGSNDDFAPFIESAKALGAKNIRVWAGGIPSAVITDAERENIVLNARSICEMASGEGISISVEYHDHSMTDSADADLAFLKMVGHDNFHTYWQQQLGEDEAGQLADLQKIAASGKLTNLHVYQYRVEGDNRFRIPISKDTWSKYLSAVESAGGDHYAFVEVVDAYPDEDFLFDAKTLLSI